MLLYLTTIKAEINHYFWNFPVFMIFFDFRVSSFKKYPCVEKLSRFDDLEFPRAETFAKWLKNAKNAKVNVRESFCP